MNFKSWLRNWWSFFPGTIFMIIGIIYIIHYFYLHGIK